MPLAWPSVRVFYDTTGFRLGRLLTAFFSSLFRLPRAWLKRRPSILKYPVRYWGEGEGGPVLSIVCRLRSVIIPVVAHGVLIKAQVFVSLSLPSRLSVSV